MTVRPVDSRAKNLVLERLSKLLQGDLRLSRTCDELALTYPFHWPLTAEALLEGVPFPLAVDLGEKACEMGLDALPSPMLLLLRVLIDAFENLKHGPGAQGHMAASAKSREIRLQTQVDWFYERVSLGRTTAFLAEKYGKDDLTISRGVVNVTRILGGIPRSGRPRKSSFK